MVSTTIPLYKRLWTLFLSLVLFYSLSPIQAFASADQKTLSEPMEWTYILTGEEQIDRFELKSSASNLFDLRDLMPGDKRSGKIHIKNATAETMEASIISIVSNLTDNTLYDALHLTIMQRGETVYDGSYGETDTPISKFYPIKGGDILTFDVTVTFPGTNGNEVANKKMDSTWTFEARYYDESKSPAGSTDPNDSPAQYSYIVNYIDEEGNKLLPSKDSLGFLGKRVTEQYKEIPGYTVDKEEKSITIRTKDNVINFIYKQNDAGAGKETVQTGIDTTTGNTGSGMSIFLLGLCITGAAVLGLRILDAKNQADKSAQNRSLIKEAKSQNED